MANKAIFSYGNGGKRKIGHSKFDMGFEHIMSANFGGLHPAAVFETLPDDYWSISDNTVTLLKPLTAPAFTRINQNFYGAYVRNQQIWKYWNDYISNGTAFGDVYGNNVTNQSLQNVWDVPSIPTSYLQVVAKLGCGNATPVFHFSVSCAKSSPWTGDALAAFIASNTTWHNVPTTSVYRITDLVQLLLNVPVDNVNPTFKFMLSDLEQIAFKDYGFDVWMYADSTQYHFLFSVYCSLRQWLSLANVLALPISLAANTTTSETTIGNNVNGGYNSGNNVPLFIRFFADRNSSEPSTSKSAFILEKSDYLSDDGSVLKSLDFYPRLTDMSVDMVGRSSSSSPWYHIWQNIASPYWGFRYCTRYAPGVTATRIFPSFYLSADFSTSTDPYWEIDSETLFGCTDFDSLKTLMESLAGNVHYLGIASYSLNGNLDMLSFSAPFIQPISVAITSGSGTFIHCRSFGLTSSVGISAASGFRVDAACDLAMYFGCDAYISAYTPNASFFSRDSKSLGYDSVSMLFYLAKQSFDLLDDFGLKVDPLSQRPFSDYRFELTNALPFFAYDKIWNDNFRNSVVSSPCLDWSESNSVIFATNYFYSDFVFANSSWAPEPAVRPSRYVGKVASDFNPTGWTLEIVTFPRNSQGSKIHTHLPVKSFDDVLALLLGHNFDLVFSSLTNVELNVFDYYMPCYYNGLLHLKYQNFNKDYFTSALLDPMSGANQVAVGSTINELRENEAKQHWWERTAMYRSIKNFFQGTFGITPIELPEDSRITGTDHIDVQIGEVIQTSGSTPESPQGTRSGLGGCRGSGNLCHGHANEHGWIFVLVSHTIESQYLQAYDKMWEVKESFMDYPVIDFAGIGNESILQKELNYTTQPTEAPDYNYLGYSKTSGHLMRYLPCASSSFVRYRGTSNPIRKISSSSGYFNVANAAGTSLDNVFGFTPRYSSYKFKFDQVSGQFRHELNFWHTFKRYLTSPILCHEFVNWEMAADDDDINRIFAVSDDFLDDKFAIDCFINASVDRALPFVCVPMSK